MITMATSQLKRLREELRPKASQEDLARRAGVTLMTYRNAESGRNVTYTTATAIRDALNAYRAEQGKPPVSLDQLGLSIV